MPGPRGEFFNAIHRPTGGHGWRVALLGWGGPGGGAYSPLDPIDATHVGELEIAWTWVARNQGLRWEAKNSSPPLMVDGVLYVTAGSRRNVVALDAGDPVWPIEERPVAAGDVPGAWYAATQPFSTKPAPFDRQGVTRDDLIDLRPNYAPKPKSSRRALRSAHSTRPRPSWTTGANKAP